MKQFAVPFLLSAVLVTSTAGVNARPIPHVVAPSIACRMPAGMPLASQARLQQKLQAFTQWSAATGTTLKGTAATERLIAQAGYEFSGSSNTLSDSVRLVYRSSTRGSAFDFTSLSYDFGNVADYPGSNFMGNPGYVQFDTLISMPSGASVYQPTGIRTYNAAGKVTIYDQPGVSSSQRTYFAYDASGKLTKSTVLEGGSGSPLDSSYRDFYSYNASGFVIRDSSESWDGSSWSPDVVYTYTVNTAGYPTQVLVSYSISGFSVVIAQTTVTYQANTMPVRSITKALNSSGVLVNQVKDSFAYNSTMLALQNIYQWDTTAKVWVLSSAEQRHFNSAGLPDSAHVQTYAIGGSSAGISVTKLTYNVAGDPVFERYYEGTPLTQVYEQRYYYGPFTSTGINAAQASQQAMMLYPIPATDKLYLHGASGGRFIITNIAGQLMQDGTLSAATLAGGIPVDGLTPGIYQLQLLDALGIVHVAQFEKR